MRKIRMNRTSNDSSHIGHAACQQVMAHMAYVHGYFVSNAPESLPFDFYATRGDETLRVQAKTARRRVKNGVEYVVIGCTRSNGQRYTAEDIDLLVAWDFESGRAFYVRASEIGGRGEIWISRRNLYEMF
jgi:hypothetical protein